MKGSVRKKPNGRWYVATHHKDHSTGKWVQKAHGGHATRKEADRVLRDVLSRMDRGDWVEPSTLTLGTYLADEWLPTKTHLRPSTYLSYRRNVELHIAPRIGHVPIQKVTPGMLRSFYEDLAADGARRDRQRGGLAPRTIRYVHTILLQALDGALDDNIVHRNPARTKRGRPRKVKVGEKREMSTWTPDELARFLAHAERDRMSAAFVLAATTGMRRSEVIGLPWSNVHLDAPSPYLEVTQALTSAGYDLHLLPPKSAESIRSISLDADTVRVLRAHRRIQAEERLAFGPGYVESGLVFTDPDGSMVHPHRFALVWRRLRDGAGVPPIRFHDIRHTYATHALEAGVSPKEISARLGHSTVAFTMDVYTHVTLDMDAAVAERVARFRALGVDPRR